MAVKSSRRYRDPLQTCQTDGLWWRLRREAMSDSDTMQPSLCRLPPELRNRIYELVLIYEAPIPIKSDGSLTNQPAIAKVCSLLRIEALSVYYSSNCFTAEACNRDVSTIKSWLLAIGSSNARHLRILEVRFCPECLGPCSAAEDSLGLSKMFSSMNVCRDAVIWLCAPVPSIFGFAPRDTSMQKDILAEAYLAYAGYPVRDSVPPCALCCGDQSSGEESSSEHVMGTGIAGPDRGWVLDKVWPTIKHRYPHVPFKEAADFYYANILHLPAAPDKPTRLRKVQASGDSTELVTRSHTSSIQQDIPTNLRCRDCNKLAIDAIELPCCYETVCSDCTSRMSNACTFCSSMLC